jgi:hypothetical protein
MKLTPNCEQLLRTGITQTLVVTRHANTSGFKQEFLAAPYSLYPAV